MASKLLLTMLLSAYGADVTTAEEERGLRGSGTPCDQRKWHIDLKDPSDPGCTNEFKVPSWVLNNPKMSFDSSDECCTILFPANYCKITDACGDESTEKDPCDDAAKWHFDMDTKRGCTNNNRYPASWEEPEVAIDMIFDTSDGCCEKFVSRGFPCPATDVCGQQRKLEELEIDEEDYIAAIYNCTGMKIEMHLS